MLSMTLAVGSYLDNFAMTTVSISNKINTGTSADFRATMRQIKALKGDIKKEFRIRNLIRHIKQIRKKIDLYKLTTKLQDSNYVPVALQKKLNREISALKASIQVIQYEKRKKFAVERRSNKNDKSKKTNFVKKVDKYTRRKNQQIALKNLTLLKKYPKTLDLNVKGESGNVCRVHRECKPGKMKENLWFLITQNGGSSRKRLDIRSAKFLDI